MNDVQMKNQVTAYFVKAKWFHEQHTPTIEEYMGVALLSSSYSCGYHNLSDPILNGPWANPRLAWPAM